jgi:putative ABC transport system ATP-binding protein
MPWVDGVIRVVGLSKIYRMGNSEIRAVDGVDLEIHQGEYLRVVGASGSGKSTLLCLLAGLDTPTAGRIETPLGDLAALSRRALARWRAEHVGMVFQSFNLIPHRTALQNVELGLLFCDVPREERGRRAMEILERVGLADRMHHRPSSLSGGEQQRVALARALVKSPVILLADEPTGNLDQENAAQIAQTLRERNRLGITVVLVTHDASLAAGDAHRTIRMHYGRCEEEPDGSAGPPRAGDPPQGDGR